LGALNRYFPQKIETRHLVSYSQSAFFTQALNAALHWLAR